MLKLHNTLLLCASESQYGISANINTAAALLVRDLEFTPIETEQFPYLPINGRLGSYRLLHSGERSRIRFRVDLERAANPDSTPPIATLFKACGFNEHTSSAAFTYRLGDTPNSVSLYLYLDGTLHVLKGCLGTMRIFVDVHEPASVEFEFLGLWHTPSTQTRPTATFNHYAKAQLSGAHNTSVNLATQALAVNSLLIDIGNSIEFQETLSAKQIILADRRAQGTIQFAAKGGEYPSANLKDNTDLALNVALKRGNKNILISLPHIQWRNNSMPQDQGQWWQRAEFSINDNLQNATMFELRFDKGVATT